MGSIGPPELILFLVILLVLFGGSKLPKLARSLGEARREFEKTTDDEKPQSAPAIEPPALSDELSKEDELRQREEAVRRREAEFRRPDGSST